MKGIINRDFKDVQTVMKDGGMSLISVGEASGEYRIQKAFMKALESPLLSNLHVNNAKKILYIIYSGEQNPVGIRELGEINELMEDFIPDVEVLWGLYRDDTLDENVKVAIIASGLDEKEHALTSAQMEDEEFHKKMESFYGIKNKKTEVPTETITDDETEEAINENDSNSDTMGQSNGFNIFKNLKEQLAIFVEKMTEE